jgi:predicted PolB exonuclease-like 3'-5' exonuclease
MIEKAVVAFDIETVPDPEIGRRVYGMSGTDAEVITSMVDARRIDTNGSTDYPQSPFHKIVCVCATIARHGRVEIRRIPGDDERAILESFYALVREIDPRLVTWNGGGFDLPIMRYRAMMHGVQAPAGFYDVHGDARIGGYLGRYGWTHVDMMDVLSGFGASSHAGLGNISKLLDLPGKAFLEKSVWEHWIEGDEATIVEYCKMDTVLTMSIFVAWAHHAAVLDRAQTLFLVEKIREAIANEPFEGWRLIEERMRSWPPWSRAG